MKKAAAVAILFLVEWVLPASIIAWMSFNGITVRKLRITRCLRSPTKTIETIS